MLEAILSSMGLAPCCARSAEEARRVCAVRAPDLALIDIDAPGWSELLAWLRGRNPLIRCCLVGAGAASHTSEELALLGTACYFSKPFSFQELMQAFDRT